MLSIQVDKGVYEKYNGLVHAAGDWLRQTQKIPHKLKITFFTDKNMRSFLKQLKYPNPQRVLGLFFRDTRDIILRQRRYSHIGVLNNGREYKSSMDKLLYILMHEFVHYEQFREGREINHQNVESRAKHLVRQFKDYWFND